MRLSQPLSRIERGFSALPSSPLGGGMIASARQRSRFQELRSFRFGALANTLPTERGLAKSSATFAKASCKSTISRSRTPNCCGWPAVLRLLVLSRATPKSRSKSSRAGWGRRPQRPGNQPRSRALLELSPGDSPSRIAGCRRLCRNHSASSETPTFFAETHSRPDCCGPQHKSLTRLCRSCGG
jgi:hypothetical protein